MSNFLAGCIAVVLAGGVFFTGMMFGYLMLEANYQKKEK